MMNLLTRSNYKTVKGEKLGILTGILYLAPAKISGYEVCAMRSIGCTEACLYTAGMGIFSNVQEARIKKTKMFFEQRDQFFNILKGNIKSLRTKSTKDNMIPAIRLNGTSDIGWSRFKLFEQHPDIQFYDYTKILKHLTKDIPNYHTTFSRNEMNDEDCKTALNMGYNVAVVFSTKKGEILPKEWNGYPVYDGDNTDVRFYDPNNHVIGLRAKGAAKKDKSGFVIKV